MSKKNTTLEAEMLGMSPETPKSPFSWPRFLRRFFLLLFTLVLMAVGAAALFLNTVFNGPSPAARDMLTVSLLESSSTEWIPRLFLEEEVIAEITAAADTQEG